MESYDVVIIGSGLAGLAMAVQLKQNDFRNFKILEREAELGGTWRVNNYPGAQVDVPSHLYSLSFEPYDWTRVFARQHELLKYTNHIIRKYNLAEFSECNTTVSGLEFNSETSLWEISSKEGKTFQSRFVVNATGALSQIKIPKFDGLDSFGGAVMHTGKWNHDFDYNNKKVAIVGNGASAIQVIPAIAPFVKELNIFQRSAHWIIPRADRAFNNMERNGFKNFPLLQKAQRASTFSQLEARFIGFRYVNDAFKIVQQQAIQHMHKSIKDKAMRKALTPDYVMGCKRILISNEYYPTLTKPHVHLHTKENGIQRLNSKGIETITGQQIDVDMVVFATGFNAAEGNIIYPIKGRRNKDLATYWGKKAHAYLGASVPYFPNLFLIAGPNTGTGHTSALQFIESQIDYIMNVMQLYRKEGFKTIEVRADVEAEYNKGIQKDLANTVWQKGGCNSWYKTEDGYNTTMYPRFTMRFARDCKNFKQDHHRLMY